MRELIIDSFAGGGGASTGIEEALGLTVDVAINHDLEAVEMHKANHLETRHYCENIWDVDPVEATGGKPVGLMWASPDCTHFSRAKGGKPVEKKIRGLAWVVVKWAKAVRPRVIILENVAEFQEWGPLTKANQPDPQRKGKTFGLFVNRLRGMGYQVQWRELCAADYGAPTIRKRLFLIARCDGQPIVWPEPTHGPDCGLFGLKPYRTAAECIDWSIPCPSIFERQKPLAENTLRRIARGIEKYVIKNPNPFILGIDHQSNPSAVWPIESPLRTVTMENRFALVAPTLAKYHGQKANEVRGQAMNQPLRTQDTSNRFALVSAFLTKFYGTNIGSDLRQPVPTITGQGQHIGQVQAFLIKYYGCGCGQMMTEPMHTVTSKDRMGLVMVAGQQYQIADIGLRMLTPRELARAQGFPDSYILTGTKSSQVARIGNSVCPAMAEALVRANVTIKKIEQVA